MNKKLLLSTVLAFAALKVDAVPPANIVITKKAAPLCNIMQIVVTLYNTEVPFVSYDGQSSAEITLPAGLTFIHTDGEEEGTVTVSNDVVTWTIPPIIRSPSSRVLTFFASADNPGEYTVTGQATDDLGITHIFSSPEPIILNFPRINNGVYVIAKNATLIAALADLLDTTFPATSTQTISIQPTAQDGTVTPLTPSSPSFVVSYVPTPDFIGYDFFTAQASDACTCTDSASMFIAVGIEGDPTTDYTTFLRQLYNPLPSSKKPVARPIQLPDIQQSSSTSVDLRDYVNLTNATAPFVYTTGGTPTHGTPTIENTFLSYTSTSLGDDTFTYTVTDGNGNTSTATVSISVVVP